MPVARAPRGAAAVDPCVPRCPGRRRVREVARRGLGLKTAFRLVGVCAPKFLPIGKRSSLGARFSPFSATAAASAPFFPATQRSPTRPARAFYPPDAPPSPSLAVALNASPRFFFTQRCSFSFPLRLRRRRPRAHAGAAEGARQPKRHERVGGRAAEQGRFGRNGCWGCGGKDHRGSAASAPAPVSAFFPSGVG